MIAPVFIRFERAARSTLYLLGLDVQPISLTGRSYLHDPPCWVAPGIGSIVVLPRQPVYCVLVYRPMSLRQSGASDIIP